MRNKHNIDQTLGDVIRDFKESDVYALAAVVDGETVVYAFQGNTELILSITDELKQKIISNESH